VFSEPGHGLSAVFADMPLLKRLLILADAYQSPELSFAAKWTRDLVPRGMDGTGILGILQDLSVVEAPLEINGPCQRLCEALAIRDTNYFGHTVHGLKIWEGRSDQAFLLSQPRQRGPVRHVITRIRTKSGEMKFTSYSADQ
jgi:hypothetical protein